MMTLGQTPATPLAPLALTLGDAAGIGPEIVIKLHLAGLPAPCVVYGDAGALRRAVAALAAPLRVIELTDVGALATYAHEVGCLFVRPTHPALPENLPLGRVDARAGQSAYDALCLAIDDAMLRKVSAIVTAPLNKEAMHAAGLDFPGHTEILAQRSRTPHVAMIPGTNQSRARQAMGIASPRIGVAGLNPHAGEHGKFGREDLDIIAPAIAQAQARGIHASGPWPGDTLFMRARMGEFDICVAQYHDQGLIPIKYLGVDQGVNITVGLPFVRTSVDHGTAFDIAGKGIADPSSLRVAFEMALTMLSQKK